MAQTELKNEEIKRKAGIGNDLDLARAQMRVAKLEAQLGRATEEKKRFHATLRLLLNLKPTAQLTLTDDLKTLGTAATGGPLRPEQHPTKKKIDHRLAGPHRHVARPRLGRVRRRDLRAPRDRRRGDGHALRRRGD